MIVMRKPSVVIGRREPLRDDNRLPNFLPGREPDDFIVGHLNLLPIFLPRQLFVGDPFELLAGLVVLLPGLNPGQFLVRHPNLLFRRHPDLFPCLFPRQFLIVNVVLLLLSLVDFLPIFNPSQLFAGNPNLLLRRNPNLLPCALLVEIKYQIL